MSNLRLASLVLEHLNNSYVEDIILCAGARNSPFLYLLDPSQSSNSLHQHPFKIYNHFEERSACFFALGNSMQKARPTAIITTSGTAAAELLPACIEAYYSSIPLILITADRPTNYRGTGAPQSIEQLGIFSSYANSFDLSNERDLINFISHFKSDNTFDFSKPLHLNICFEEPLIDDPNFNLNIEKIQIKNSLDKPKQVVQKINLNHSEESSDELGAISNFCQNTKSPLVLVSGLFDNEQQIVYNFLKSYPGPCFVEATSGLKFATDNQLQCSEVFLKKCFDKKLFDGLIRIGGVPTSRIWRDLEITLKDIPVLSFSQRKWTGLARKSAIVQNLESITNNTISDCHWDWSSEIFSMDKYFRSLQDKIIIAHPNSEQGLIHGLSKLVKTHPLYLGNSLPIREWDSFSTTSPTTPSTKTEAPSRQSFQKIIANRGANGIDGQLSTYFGWAKSFGQSYALFGDLTTLYDLTAPWIINQTPTSTNFNICIMNNHGGMIFDKMFKKEIFLNRHKLDFKNWSQMWNLNYLIINEFNSETFNSISSLALNKYSEQSKSYVLELIPYTHSTDLVHAELELLWKNKF